MEDGKGDRGERESEDTDELLFTDLEDESGVFGQSSSPLKLDHCDLLLDAIDAQLSRLQVQNHKHDIRSAELSRSQSESRDTGLGSTITTNNTPVSCVDLVPSCIKDQSIGLVPRVPSCSSGTGAVSDGPSSVEPDGTGESKYQAPRTRLLAGVPVLSFDTVTIDSDLDSVRTENIRQHIRPRCRSVIQSMRSMDGLYSDKSDIDTSPNTPGHAVLTVSHGREARRSLLSRKHHPSRRNTPRNTPRYVGDEDDDEEEDTDAGVRWRRRRRRDDKSDELAKLRQDCDEEEERLRLKRAQLCAMEHSLSDLLHKREHALQELEQLRLEDSLGRSGVSVSLLEREEMERQLDGAKTELFTEQRRSRIRLDSLQEQLEEAREELQRVTDEERLLRSRCVRLEEERHSLEAVELQVSGLRRELGERESRVGALEKILAQKELRLLGLQEERSALEEEREGLRGEIQSREDQHLAALREAQEQALLQGRRELQQQKEELAVVHKEEVQQVQRQAEAETAAALLEQARSHTQHLEAVQTRIQHKEEEGRELRKALEEQKEVVKRREEELQATVQKTVEDAVEQQRRRGEEEKEQAVKVHAGMLEDQHREALERAGAETERERRHALGLQNTVLELQQRLQELEREACGHQGALVSVQAALHRTLGDEHQAELQRLCTRMEQERREEESRLEQRAWRAEEEAGRLRSQLAGREAGAEERTARLEQQARRWGQELGAECGHLQLLLEDSGAPGSPGEPPHCPTVAQAVQTLRALRVQLQQEMSFQRRSAQHLSRDKERELRLQREQLEMEREQALDSLKERLIQEHIEELSRATRAQQGGGVAWSLHKQLQDKDQELRQVQRNMGQWKEQTSARLACKFEQELTSELERCKARLLKGRKAPKAREEKQRTLDQLGPRFPPSSPPLPPGASPPDLASLKLLRHLQGRVQQLRAENQAQACSPSPPSRGPPTRGPRDLAGSYLETIAPSQHGVGFWSPSSSTATQS
ncbi:trichohyalin [Osmerus eperlanus]|uniref:trichohyalin n=1 Tax=Osmerus eperlanus TaxID=29151 RepID=UPI002E0F9CB1